MHEQPLLSVAESMNGLMRERLHSSWMVETASDEVLARNRQRVQDFLEATRDDLGHGNVRSIPADSDRFALFVGWRRDPRLEYVFRNVLHFLSPDWGLQVIAWPDVMADIQQFSHAWSHVHYIQVADVEQSEGSYHALLTRPPFWERVKGSHVLLFDADTLLCRPDVAPYLDYDFVGSPWAIGKSVSPVIRVGDGGFSLRRTQTMHELATDNRRLNVIKREDVFFALHLHLDPIRYRLPALEDATRFAVEAVYHDAPLGLHRPWDCLPTEQLESLLNGITYHQV